MEYSIVLSHTVHTCKIYTYVLSIKAVIRFPLTYLKPNYIKYSYSNIQIKIAQE